MSETQDPEVLTAVEFLSAVVNKGHTETTLRTYLHNRRKLTIEQVNLAFEIFNLRRSRQTERPEVVIPEGTTLTYPKYSFLMLAKREEGEKLIKRFLKEEYNYVNVLQCLNGEY
jgi:hypothetical protein